jgi:hypothetical protein
MKVVSLNPDSLSARAAVAETLEALVEMIHPENSRRALEGIVWERLAAVPSAII